MPAFIVEEAMTFDQHIVPYFFECPLMGCVVVVRYGAGHCGQKANHQFSNFFGAVYTAGYVGLNMGETPWKPRS